MKTQIVLLCTPQDSTYDFFEADAVSAMHNSGIGFELIQLGLNMSVKDVFQKIQDIEPEYVVISTNFEPEAFVAHRLELEKLGISRQSTFSIIFAGETAPPHPDKTIMEISTADAYYKKIHISELNLVP